jgi:hypothetical protein
MPATRDSWKNLQPLPALRSQLAVQRVFTEQEYQLASSGFIPESMEDKWFIFAEAGTLYLHRSWTGHCIYQVSMVKEGPSYVIGEAFANRDPSQYAGMDDGYDERLLMFLIDSLLLGMRAPLPLPVNQPAGIATELHLHHAVGAGQKTAARTVRLSLWGMVKWLWHWLFWMIKRR